jgi:CheY-like chemotaxis protein
MNILLIDDDRDDAELFEEVLKEIDSSIGFDHIEDSKKGLEKLAAETSNLPDIIFLDINMPIVSGWQCLDEFKKTEHLKNIPVILFTTSSQPKEKENALLRGASGFITKPNEYQVLKNSLSEVIHQKIG